jgi:hypothetical protein
MKNLYYIVVLVLGFTMATSCSSDKDNSDPVIETTFLETYQGTVWHIAINELNSEYLKFRNDETVPFEQWGLIYGAGCYEHINYNVNDFSAVITENSEDYLEITFPSGHVWIFAVEDGLLHWVDVSEDGIYDYVYDSQNATVIDDLDICWE